MNFQEFKPHGSTGTLVTDIFYRSQGSHYEILREPHHTNADVDAAKMYLYRNFDVVSITVIKETP